MPKLILLLALAIAAWIIYHLAKQNIKKHGKKYLVKVALLALAGLILLAVITGRAPGLMALAAGVIPFLGRLTSLLRFWPMLAQLYHRHRSGRPSTGNQSQVHSAWLAMTLDHDSGKIDGEVLAGAFKGQRLSALSIQELQALYRECQLQDAESLRLLDAYAQRERAGEWQAGSEQQSAAPTNSAMSIENAWEILGLQPGASREQIIATHKRLISKLHPDKGGSNFLASQINRAKDVLLEAV